MIQQDAADRALELVPHWAIQPGAHQLLKAFIADRRVCTVFLRGPT